MKTLPDKGVTIRCVLTDQKVGGSSPSERAKIIDAVEDKFKVGASFDKGLLVTIMRLAINEQWILRV